MDIVKVFNIFEIFLWCTAGVFFLMSGLRKNNKLWYFSLILAVVFIAYGASDYVEIQTGVWWSPWWLFVWKAICIIIFVVVFYWFVRDQKNQAIKKGLKDNFYETKKK